MSQRLLTSGELAREAGVNVETLRYYERRRLLPSPVRTESGHRRYGSEALALLKLIKGSQEIGFTLAEIGDLLRELERPKAVCDDICQAIEAKISRVDQELTRLRAQRKRLSRLRAACPRTRPLRECPVIVGLRESTPRRTRS